MIELPAERSVFAVITRLLTQYCYDTSKPVTVSCWLLIAELNENTGRCFGFFLRGGGLFLSLY